MRPRFFATKIDKIVVLHRTTEKRDRVSIEFMRNTLALIDPADGHVTDVVAENVEMELNEVPESAQDKSNAQVAEEWDEKTGLIAPVAIDASDVDALFDAKNIRRVVLMNKAGDALVTGSGWIADGMIKGGNALARRITLGTRELEGQIKPAENPVMISEETRLALEKFGQVTGTVTRAATNAFDSAITAAIKGVHTLHEQGKDPNHYEEPKPEPSSSRQSEAKQLGQSALKAVVTVLSGTGIAAGAVGDSARTAIVDLIKKKYGPDAGFVAARTLRATKNIAEMLVYFDALGISRQVVMRGTKQLGGIKPGKNSRQRGSESDSESTDSPDENEDLFQQTHVDYPSGPPPPYPPRPSQYRKSLDNDGFGDPNSPLPSAPPPYPTRPSQNNMPTTSADDAKEQVEEAHDTYIPPYPPYPDQYEMPIDCDGDGKKEQVEEEENYELDASSSAPSYNELSKEAARSTGDRK